MIGTDEPRYGYKFEPVTVDISVQFQAINEINLNEEYFDATIVLHMTWHDSKLAWTSIEEKAKVKNLEWVENHGERNQSNHRNDKMPVLGSIRVTEDEV